jgi:hypothetical protein
MECVLAMHGKRQHIHLGQFIGGVTVLVVLLLMLAEEEEEED